MPCTYETGTRTQSGTPAARWTCSRVWPRHCLGGVPLGSICAIGKAPLKVCLARFLPFVFCSALFHFALPFSLSSSRPYYSSVSQPRASIDSSIGNVDLEQALKVEPGNKSVAETLKVVRQEQKNYEEAVVSSRTLLAGMHSRNPLMLMLFSLLEGRKNAKPSDLCARRSVQHQTLNPPRK